MRKVLSLVLAAMMVMSLSACAGMGKKETSRVKCPACGHEFQAPASGG